MDDDWDLQAVVRGCTTTTTPSTSTTTTTPTITTTATTTTPPSSTMGFNSFSQQTPQNDNNSLTLQDLFRPRNEKTTAPIIEDLCDLYKPFYYKPSSKSLSPQNVPVSPLSVLGGFQDLSSQQQQQQPKPKQIVSSSSVVMKNVNTTRTQSSKSKRRKNQMKRVCQVPAEGLSSDMWSWRKYGQKPIKGSPYPRGYYKCSTAKGCLARKQVERNRSNPNMFIVTYTAEHNHPMPTHRNSLAGSTRLKPSTSGDTKPASSSPESPGTSLSAALEKLESSREEKDDMIEEDNDDDFGISDMPLDDDFFAGLDDELPQPGPARVEDFLSPFPENGQVSWLANNATTTAAGGGC